MAGSIRCPRCGRLRLSRRTPELARSVLHPGRGCQGQEWGGTDLPWMGAGRTPAPSGADGLISRALDGSDSLTRREPLRSGRRRVSRERRMKIW
jgi:hypothetical protein